MAFYIARRFIVDATNHYNIPRNYYVDTEDDLWVKRFGVFLKPVSGIPEGHQTVCVSNTKEGSSQKSHASLAPKKSDDKDVKDDKPKAKLQGRARTKVVEESTDK